MITVILIIEYVMQTNFNSGIAGHFHNVVQSWGTNPKVRLTELNSEPVEFTLYSVEYTSEYESFELRDSQLNSRLIFSECDLVHVSDDTITFDSLTTLEVIR